MSADARWGTRLKWGGGRIEATADELLANASPCVPMTITHATGARVFLASMRPIEAERLARALMKAAKAARGKVKR